MVLAKNHAAAKDAAAHPLSQVVLTLFINRIHRHVSLSA
jgi:hypothetical protein